MTYQINKRENSDAVVQPLTYKLSYEIITIHNRNTYFISKGF